MFVFCCSVYKAAVCLVLLLVLFINLLLCLWFICPVYKSAAVCFSIAVSEVVWFHCFVYEVAVVCWLYSVYKSAVWFCCVSKVEVVFSTLF